MDAPEIEIDAIGLLCPLPVLRLRKRLQDLAPGTRLALATDDPVAVVDIPHFCAEAGHAVEDRSEDGPVTRWIIRKG